MKRRDPPAPRAGKEFQPVLPRRFRIRPRPEHWSQHHHGIPAVIGGFQLGNRRYIIRRPGPQFFHPLIPVFPRCWKRNSGQIPQPRLQGGSLEHAGEHYGTAQEGKAEKGIIVKHGTQFYILRTAHPFSFTWNDISPPDAVLPLTRVNKGKQANTADYQSGCQHVF